jgi:hypothetical protein
MDDKMLRLRDTPISCNPIAPEAVPNVRIKGDIGH